VTLVTLEIIQLIAGEHRSEEFTKINPFQKIPVIDHDGFVLTERYCVMGEHSYGYCNLWTL